MAGRVVGEEAVMAGRVRYYYAILPRFVCYLHKVSSCTWVVWYINAYVPPSTARRHTHRRCANSFLLCSSIQKK